MGSTRRDFIKNAAVAGAVAASSSPHFPKDAGADVLHENEPADDTERCPYFDQPMLCKDIAPNGKRLCDE